MSENREEILADFQACTGIEDIGEAFLHLDESNWDLLRAVNRVMPPNSQSFQANVDPDVMVVEDNSEVVEVPFEQGTDMMEVGNNVGHQIPKPIPVRPMPDLSQPSTSSISNHSNKMVKFNVEFCDKVVPIVLPDTATINVLKIRIHREFKVTPCRQILSGLPKMAQYESTPISNLGLPVENNVTLTIKQNEAGFLADDESDITERLSGTYTLNINFENKKVYNVRFPGTKTILDVKSDVYSLTNVHVRNQIWSGWPPNIDDQTVLAMSGISYPEHDLTLRKNVLINHNRDRPSSNTNIINIDSDDEEFEDANESLNVDDDYLFVDNVAPKRTEPLIPENIEDEIVGSITFSEQFTARYGPIHPAFYQGTLEDAIKEACSKPAKDRKILAIYLHHDASVLTNVFCTQLLGYESVMQMFENNFILWGWDLTFESNRTRLQTSVGNALGAVAAMSLRNIPVDRLPALIIIMKIRSNTDIFSVIHGNVGVNELLSSLIEATEVFSEHQRVEIKEEQERAERELVKWEQDQAYFESLQADRAKEEAKQKQAHEEEQTKKRIENEKAEEQRKKENLRQQVLANLPPEPLDQGDNITKIRFRLPKGQNIERRFLATTPLKVLLDFLIVKGYPTEEYKVISSWPRRDLTSLNSSQTLQELKLCPQETVILEER